MFFSSNFSFACSAAFANDDGAKSMGGAGAVEGGESKPRPAEVKLTDGSTVSAIGRGISVKTPSGDTKTIAIAPSPVESRLCGLRSTYSGDPKTVWIELIRKASAISDWTYFNNNLLIGESIKPIKGEVKVKEEDEAQHDALARKIGSLPQGLRSADRQFLTLLGSSLYEMRNAGYTHVSYKVHTRRIDTLVSNGNGDLSVISGDPTELGPEPPHIPAGFTALCNIYVSPGQKPIAPADVVAIGPKMAVEPVLKVRNQSALAKTLAKLNSSEQVNVVFWGDSITVGGFATERSACFVEQFLKMLKQTHPDNKLGYALAAVSGSNTSMRMGSLDKDVIGLKPDLVCCEFFNDFSIPKEQVERNWAAAISRFKAAGIEVLICVPHLPAPSYVHMESIPQVADSFYPDFLRKLSKEQNVALADVGRRWAHLPAEGIKPTRLLSDGSIHPNSFGHSIYASELITAITGERPL
jgi:lysophospholipase L1-like esterase